MGSQIVHITDQYIVDCTQMINMWPRNKLILAHGHRCASCPGFPDIHAQASLMRRTRTRLGCAQRIWQHGGLIAAAQQIFLIIMIIMIIKMIIKMMIIIIIIIMIMIMIMIIIIFNNLQVLCLYDIYVYVRTLSIFSKPPPSIYISILYILYHLLQQVSIYISYHIYTLYIHYTLYTLYNT